MKEIIMVTTCEISETVTVTDVEAEIILSNKDEFKEEVKRRFKEKLGGKNISIERCNLFMYDVLCQ